jgi:hypothetical protein
MLGPLRRSSAQSGTIRKRNPSLSLYNNRARPARSKKSRKFLRFSGHKNVARPRCPSEKRGNPHAGVDNEHVSGKRHVHIWRMMHGNCRRSTPRVPMCVMPNTFRALSADRCARCGRESCKKHTPAGCLWGKIERVHAL